MRKAFVPAFLFTGFVMSLYLILTLASRTPPPVAQARSAGSVAPARLVSATAPELLPAPDSAAVRVAASVPPPPASSVPPVPGATGTASADDGQVGESALKQIVALQEEKAARSAAQNKISSQLLYAGKQSRGEAIAPGVRNLQMDLDRDGEGRILVDIKAEVSDALLAEIRQRGGEVINSFAEYRSVRAAVPLDRIEELGLREEVEFVGPAVRAERHTGSVNSEGDIAQNAAAARVSFGVDGTGVKVAVLSDSVDFLAQSQGSGDLGTVTVLPGQSGVPASGEGTAMLEIVHDIAPGAQLYYATAFNGPASFANNIRQLRAAGCDIIIDDVSYFNESPFQDGIIAQAVNDVTAAGALYFSSAGNSGNKNDNESGVWEGDFSDGGQVAAPITGQGRLHSFGPANYNPVLSGGSQRHVDLFWADPLGKAANDYDVYVLDATGANVVGAGTDTQNGNQDPYELITKLDPGQRIVIVKYSGTARYLYLGTGRGRLTYSTGAQVRGHSCAANAYCVAAVSAANATTPFTASAKVERFSSDGPRRIFYEANGTPITPGDFSSTGGTVRQKPDIAAADGVRTTLPPDSGLNPFYGTSAAAPHAGAIAALLKSYRPNLTTAEMRQAITGGTLDIEAPGVDRDAGNGLTMANLILQSVSAVQPPTITGFTPGNGPVGTVVTVSGTKFNSVTAVRFNGANAAFTPVSSSQLTATVPTGATTGAITVVTPDGTATSAATFTVTATPAITGFSPASGNIGTIVTITGANLGNATGVSFGGTAAITFTINSGTQITATVPLGATSGKISVTTPGGTVQSSSSFTVTVLPVVTSFSPVSAGIGASVVIAGANFVNVTAVRFNGIAAVNPVVNSANQITATVPSGAATGPISVTTTTGTVQSATAFTVIPSPVIAGFSPGSGPAGTSVAVTGTGFSGATAVTFNNVNAAAFLVVSDTQITASAPAGVSTGPLRVMTPGGTAVSAASFSALAAPANDNYAAAQVIAGSSGTVTGSNVGATKEVNEPDHALNSGGRSVWYRWTAPASGTWAFNTLGSAFDTTLAVYTGATLPALVLVAYNDDIVDTVNTNSQLAFLATAGTTYSIAVDGFSSGGQNPTPAASGSLVLSWAPTTTVPAVASFSPASGPVGTPVVVTGANLSAVTNVSFSRVSAPFTINSGVQLTATVPAGASNGPIRLVAPGGTAFSANTFTVLVAANNDGFANAFLLSGNSGRTNCSSTSASKEPGEPNHAGNTGGKSVWFRWTAPSSGLWSFDTIGSSFDTLLAVYTGNAVGSLVSVAANDDAFGQQTSQVTLNATVGTTYRIAVDGYAGAGGDVTLGWSLSAGTPVIAGFTPQSGGPGTPVVITGQNLGGTIGVKFNGIAAATFAVNLDTQVTATVPAGAGSGPITLTTASGVAQSQTSFVVNTQAPANDNFAGRIALTGAIRTVTGSNNSATREAGEPNHAGNSGGKSVWWSWTAPSNGTYSVSTRGSDFDTLLGVYTGTTVTGLALVASNDDGPNMGSTSIASFAATGGTVYQVAVDGYGGVAGNIVLSIYPSVLPQTIYSTHFDAAEGYSTALALAGQHGWVKQGPGNEGVVNNFFQDSSQQAFLGFSSTQDGASTWLWQPLNLSPVTNTRPVVKFSVAMEIVDSDNGLYDNFGWDVFNRDGKELFFLNFDNTDLGIYYLLNDGGAYHYTGTDFRNGQIYALEVSMDFGRNRWSATLDGSYIVTEQPISAAGNLALNLGDIDATWSQTAGGTGNNYMLFDNYSVSAQKSEVPTVITSPQNQAVLAGGNASFLVVVDSSLEVAYQWLFNGSEIAGATLPTLSLNAVSISQQGAYSVRISNAAGTVTTAAAQLTVTSLANLAPFQPAGWSDKIVVAATASTNAPAPPLTDSQEIFVSWAAQNSPSGGNISSRFYTQLYLDGAPKTAWFTDSLNAGSYAFIIGYNLGKLSPGSHILRIDVDSTGVIGESDETDNSYSRTFVVSSSTSTPPQVTGPSFSTNGTFQFTLTGISNRTYQVSASTNLLSWDLIATILNTNANGVIRFSDPASTNLPRRYYRTSLVVP
jgi:hypothetical protein